MVFFSYKFIEQTSKKLLLEVCYYKTFKTINLHKDKRFKILIIS